jgi:hypothetical protein
VISNFGDLLASKGKVVYGRQYSDRDFFELSKRNLCLQVIDPSRPPFQSVKHIKYNWDTRNNKDGFFEAEYTDEELRQFARDGRVLVSLMFWSGMIREIANFYSLIDLFAVTRLRCGLVLTSQSYAYMMHSPLELITVPLEQGGVFPLVEPVLGSCGIGVGIESYMTKERIKEDLKEGLKQIAERVGMSGYIPRGWWTTMDTQLRRLNWLKRLRPVKFLRYPPYIQIRFTAKDAGFNDHCSKVSLRQRYVEKVKNVVKGKGLERYFLPYRPYEFYEPGPLVKEIIECAKEIGFEYMFTKAGFNSAPEIKYIDSKFIVLNYTAGQWDGWTPFETVNDVSDLRKAEKILLKRNKPGWLVSTIDSCQWTFSGEFWRKGSRLYEIAKFCADGGDSGEMINVKPVTVARYARVMAENNLG